MANKSGSKKQIIFLGILIVMVFFFLVGQLIITNSQARKKIITNGDRAPEFTLKASDGRFVNLSDFRGKVVMVHFWATWCPPCVDEIPTLDKLNQAFMGKDFDILAVSVDEGGLEAVNSFMRKNRLNIPVLFDPQRMTAGLYGTFKFPETYIVDRQGVVRYKAIGPRDWLDPENIKIIKDIILSRG